ncbi:guanylate kinase [Thermocaproicibacter melissae]|jgi:guanylate kinase|uniref:guanylate kinase n=1 Tax=Thermocaproicibacter melissae TaxID=2966552 RepID=UPI0024B0D183|nr:guanylate kinase [Thermocaproicibacter melissae]WBY63342.1 guanylate kinase [Thermocaproicibacter melissae]
MTNRGLLVVLSGPSGAGKGTIVKALLERRPQIRLSISATTRAPRQGETDGKEYYFISREKFSQMAEEGKMLETAEYCGNFYGTPAAPIEEWTSQGNDVILEIEVQGGANVKKKRPDSVGIFILPPSREELERRLRTRGTESDDVIRERLAAADRELKEVEHYDYVVVNDTVENAVEKICSILQAEKCKTARNAELLERMQRHD